MKIKIFPLSNYKIIFLLVANIIFYNNSLTMLANCDSLSKMPTLLPNAENISDMILTLDEKYIILLDEYFGNNRISDYQTLSIRILEKGTSKLLRIFPSIEKTKFMGVHPISNNIIVWTSSGIYEIDIQSGQKLKSNYNKIGYFGRMKFTNDGKYFVLDGTAIWDAKFCVKLRELVGAQYRIQDLKYQEYLQFYITNDSKYAVERLKDSIVVFNFNTGLKIHSLPLTYKTTDLTNPYHLSTSFAITNKNQCAIIEMPFKWGGGTGDTTFVTYYDVATGLQTDKVQIQIYDNFSASPLKLLSYNDYLFASFYSIGPEDKTTETQTTIDTFKIELVSSFGNGYQYEGSVVRQVLHRSIFVDGPSPYVSFFSMIFSGKQFFYTSDAQIYKIERYDSEKETQVLVSTIYTITNINHWNEPGYNVYGVYFDGTNCKKPYIDMDNNVIVTYDESNWVRYYNIGSGTLRNEWEVPISKTKAKYSHLFDAEYFISKDRVIILTDSVWDYAPGNTRVGWPYIYIVNLQNRDIDSFALFNPAGFGNYKVFNYEHNLLYSTQLYSDIGGVYNLSTHEQIRQLSAYPSVAFTDNSKQLVGAATDGYVYFWNLENGDLIRRLECQDCEVLSLNQGSSLAILKNNHLSIYSAKYGTLIREYLFEHTHSSTFLPFSLSDDGNYFYEVYEEASDYTYYKNGYIAKTDIMNMCKHYFKWDIVLGDEQYDNRAPDDLIFSNDNSILWARSLIDVGRSDINRSLTYINIYTLWFIKDILSSVISSDFRQTNSDYYENLILNDHYIIISSEYIGNIKLYDLMGNCLVNTFKVSKGILRLNMSGYVSGIYILSLDGKVKVLMIN